jgi:hypothetical protein
MKRSIFVFAVLSLALCWPHSSLALEQGLEVPGSAGGFLGDGRCANPTCHGMVPPTKEADKQNWRPWRSARTQWKDPDIDRHSRAYRTLQTAGGRAIAGYMGIPDATNDKKCTACHAPKAGRAANGSAYEARQGVTCEHCHGAAEHWLDSHVSKEWKAAKSKAQGFVDLANFQKRAERCAACHTVIDHEILAGGHPPLQFEMVAYAQIMKHWDDGRDDSDQPLKLNIDPTLWAVGQVVGLENALSVIPKRATESNYQSMEKFGHFKDSNCYQCHHKLLADALRQTRGHYAMVEQVLSVRPVRGSLSSQWADLVSAVDSSPEAASQKAKAMSNSVSGVAASLLAQPLSADETRRLLRNITASGDKFRSIERFRSDRPDRENYLLISNIDEPWWYTTGAPEQAALAIGALCDPGFGERCRGLLEERKKLKAALNRASYSPDGFVRSLNAINAQLK